MVRTITSFCMFICLGTALLLSGCGSSDSPTSPATKTAYLVGSLIEFMPYRCGSTIGKTGRVGQFSYTEGDSCTFTLGKMSFTVRPDKLKKGYVTAYDLTNTKEEAWALMAIVDSISYRRPGSDLILIMDPNLDYRIPTVDLKQGDAAISAALAPFKGTVPTVTLQQARERLAKTVKEDNTLVLSHDQIVAQGKALLDSLKLHVESGTQWEPPTGTATKAVIVHSNIVNLRFYDNENNPMRMDFGNSTTQLQYKYVTLQQDPNNSGLNLCMSCSDVNNSAMNAAALVFNVGRSSSCGPGFAMYSLANGTAQDQNVLTSSCTDLSYIAQMSDTEPISLFAKGAHPNEGTYMSFPNYLNFTFQTDLTLDNANTHAGISIPGMVFGQGSNNNIFTRLLDMLLTMAEIGYDAVEVFDSYGTAIYSDYSVVKGTKEVVEAALDLQGSNWWVMSANAVSTPTYRVTYQGHPALMFRAAISGSSQSAVVIVTSPYDDHTFDFHVIYPGQSINGMSAN